MSGSFDKFKPQIDELHEAFADHGVRVLEPTRGWLSLPSRLILPTSFRPLPSERGLSIREIEDRFLRAIDRADFLYIYNSEGYIGTSGALEIGYAVGKRKPIYAKEAIDFLELADYDLRRKAFLEEHIVIAGISEIVAIEQTRREASNYT